MNLFKEIVDESLLLNELKDSRDNDIKKAINNVLRVRISYDDKKDKVISKAKGKKERYILPVAYGITKNGKRAIRAYQTAGSTKRGVPKWKLFLLDNIYSWTNGHKSFKEYADTLIRLGLNTKGDKHMTTLFAITPIGNNNIPVAKDSNPIGPNPISKVDVSPTTQTTQNPKITKKSDEFVPASTKHSASIDNSNVNSYVNNGVNTPDTEPVTKTEINPQDNNTQSINEPKFKTEPVTKNDVDDTIDVQDNKLTNSFKDMINRMDNLNNDNEEEI